MRFGKAIYAQTGPIPSLRKVLRTRHCALAMSLVAIVLVYANSFSNGFHFDDFHTVVDNPAVRSMGNLRRIFTDTTAFSVLPANQTYRPVVTASLAIDYALGHGYVPFWFHLSSLLWFLVLVSLSFLFFETLLNRVDTSPANRWLALGIAGWFGVHPAMAETVNYVIQRGDLYCTLGCVGGLFVYARWPLLRRYGLYLVPFTSAMLSKPPAAVFPVLLLLYCFFFEGSEQPFGSRWRRSFAAAVPALVLTALLLWLQARMTPRTFLPSIVPPAAYRLAQGFVWLRYAGALFLPLHLNVDTDLQPLSTFDGRAASGAAFGLALAAAIVYSARRRRLYPIAYGLLWFAITLLPTSVYPLSEVENDHRMFFAFPGLMLAAVWSLRLAYVPLSRRASEGVRRRWLPRAVAVCAALSLGGYAWGAHRRNLVWRSEDTLWADDVLKSPGNGRGLMIYGLTRMNAGDLAGASRLYTQALAYTPNYPTLEVNLGIVNGLLAAEGDPKRNVAAQGHFERALALAPGDDTTHAYYGRWLLGQNRLAEATAQLQTAVALNAQRPMGRDLLLEAYQRGGDTVAARGLAQGTLRLLPDDPHALLVLRGEAKGFAPHTAGDWIDASQAAYRAGRFQEAVANARQALVLDPGSAEAWNNLGAGDGALHQWSQAIAEEQQAVRLNPKLAIAQNNLRWFLRESNGAPAQPAPGIKTALSAAGEYVDLSLTLNRQGRFDESIAAAGKALELDPNAAEAWNNIAANDEALHRWDDAIDAARKALALRPDFQLAKNNLAWALQQRKQGMR